MSERILPDIVPSSVVAVALGCLSVQVTASAVVLG